MYWYVSLVPGLVEADKGRQGVKDCQVGEEVRSVGCSPLAFLAALRRVLRRPTNCLQGVSRWSRSSGGEHKLQSGVSVALEAKQVVVLVGQ